MSRQSKRASRGLGAAFPIGRGVLLGAVAYVVGYIVTYLFVALSSDDRSLGILSALTDISQFDLTGWMFYNAHFVDVTASTRAGGRSQSESTNMLSEATDLAVPEPIWYLVPIVLLILSGFVVALTISRTDQTTKAVSAGATIFAGYFPLSVLGLFLFGTSMDFSTFGQRATVTIGPNKVLGIALAGFAFPVICGMLGGFLASMISTGNPSSRRRRVSRNP